MIRLRRKRRDSNEPKGNGSADGSGTVEGLLEGVFNGRAFGWAWDSARPGERLEVELIVDGDPAATGVADLEREALAVQGKGDGRYVFKVTLPRHLTGTPFHTIKAVAGPERVALPSAPRFRVRAKGADRPWSRVDFAPEGSLAARRWASFKPEDDEPPGAAEAALVGERGWLFPWEAGDAASNGRMPAPQLTPEQVELQRERLVARHRRLKELGVPHLFAVAPAKDRVADELLPKGVSRESYRAISQINEALQESSCPELIDLLPPLQRGRRHGSLFNRTDSHWSHRGAFFAYRALMIEAAKRVISLEPIEIEEASFVAIKGHQGDLSERPKVTLTSEGVVEPYTDERAWSEKAQEIDASKLRSRRMPPPEHLTIPGSHRAPHLYEIPDDDENPEVAALPRAVLLGDSWCLGLIPWLAEHFQRFVFLWTEEPPLEAIELEMPDIVFHVVSERTLGAPRDVVPIRA